MYALFHLWCTDTKFSVPNWPLCAKNNSKHCTRHRKVNMDATDANVFTLVIIWRAVEANKFIRRRRGWWKQGEREFIFIWLSLSLDPLSSQLFSIFIEWPKNNQWRKSPMNHNMTVQTDVKLQNIGTVSDLGPHMEVAQFRNWKDQNPCGLCCLHCCKRRKKQTDLDPFFQV